MRRAALIAAALLGGCVRATAPDPRPAPPPTAQHVTFLATDGAVLHGFIYIPEGAGPFPAVLWNHGSEKFPGWQPALGAFYRSNGFAFFMPHRRGHGDSGDAGPYIMDRQPSNLLILANAAEAGRTIVALHEEASRDVDAALAWLKARPDIDPGRIVMSGVSFGGVQALLAAERGLGVRAFAAFGPAAVSWQWVTGLDRRLETAVERAQAPLLIVQAQNDYDLGPSRVLGPLLERSGKGRAVVFPAFGKTEQDGHGAFASSAEGTAIWGPTVLAFFHTALAR